MIDFRLPTPVEVAAAQAGAVDEANGIVAEVLAVPAGRRTFANTIVRLEDAADVVERAQGRHGFMSYVAEDAEVRAAADTLREALEKYEIELGFREDVYNAVQDYAQTPEAASLTGEDRRVLEFTLRDYRRDGFDLPSEQRGKVKELKTRLVELGLQFQRNIDTYDDAILISREELIGLPDAYISGLKTEQKDGQTLYRVSLDYPELHPFLDNAEREDLRKELLVKSFRKGGEANIGILEEAIAVRDQLARLLGYDSWAAYVLEVRMAKSPPAVREFLTDLRAKIEPKRAGDMGGLEQAKRDHTGGAGSGLHLWDWRFYHNYLLKTKYAVDDFEVAKYFPLDAVMDGLFDVYQKLLGVRFESVEPANAWHPEVKLYRILDAGDGHEVAHFYMDLFPRPNKYGHAAAFTLVGGRKLGDGSYQKPISAIVANFTKPTAGQPSLLRHTEVETLFHEFGHILHQTLTTRRAPALLRHADRARLRRGAFADAGALGLDAGGAGGLFAPRRHRRTAAQGHAGRDDRGQEPGLGSVLRPPTLLRRARLSPTTPAATRRTPRRSRRSCTRSPASRCRRALTSRRASATSSATTPATTATSGRRSSPTTCSRASRPSTQWTPASASSTAAWSWSAAAPSTATSLCATSSAASPTATPS